MTSIIFHKVHFYYDNPYAEVFDDLSLLIDTGWRTGIVGRNGLGKSTLLKLIAGELVPVSGQVDVPLTMRFFPAPVDPGRPTNVVVRDAVAPFTRWELEMERLLVAADKASLDRYGEVQETYQRAGGYEVDGRIEREFHLMGLDAALLARPFASLSGGEQTKALIASLFIDDDAFPLIDEPTNHLDMAGRHQLMDYLAAKSGFIVISHDRHFLDGAVDHILSLNKSDVRINRGSYTSWRRQMDEELRFEQRRRENIEKEINQLERAARQRRRGAAEKEKSKYGDSHQDRGFTSHRASKQMKKAVSMERRIENQLDAKKSLLANQEKARRLRLETNDTNADTLLTVQNITLRRGERTLLTDFSLSVSPQERIAITGPNGCGKTTLFDAIEGRHSITAGVIDRPAWITLSRASQQPQWHNGYLRVHLDSEAMDETRFRQLMATFGVAGDMFERRLETFSHGQLKKVDLCRSMMIEADLFLWDEPLNFVDVFSREQIETAIAESQPTLVFIEHDRRFIEQVATRVVTL